MTVEVIIVLVALVAMLTALIMDKMRPGMILFSVVVIFLCTGILSPKEMLEGFSNKGMITVAMLFLVSEGIRQSGALTQVIKKLLPQSQTTVFKAQARMLPTIAFISAFLNNTPVVVIFAPIIKRWANYVKLPATYFLIPLSYVTILGGICTLIGTSTNLVVHSMIQEAGMKGFSMFELGKVGIFIAIAGIIYLFLFSSKLLPADRPETLSDEEEENNPSLHPVEAVIGARFPGINKRVNDFDFKRHYGAEVKELRRGGNTYKDLSEIRFREGDTLILLADDSFVKTWGESSVFIMLANGKDYEPAGKKKRWFALFLLLFMIIGATIGELPAIQKLLPEGIKLDVVKEIKEVRRGRIKEYAEAVSSAVYTEGKGIWTVPCDIALPCATQNELNLEDAKALLANGCFAVAEGANMPSTREATDLFVEKKILFMPGKAANAGGVATSGLEQSQNSLRLSWTFEEVDERLHKIMADIFAKAADAAERYGVPGNYVAGANIAGFEKVVEAMIAQGVV